jgi:glycosyltransferase involved in cell wall biosynthesis
LESTDHTQHPCIAICICTYRRPEGLARVLGGIGALRFERLPKPELVVVVADNEGSAKAATITDQFSTRHGIATVYVVEQRRGISHARNACLDAVPDDADLVAFLDDDVRPGPTWLEELMLGIEKTGADAISGPQQPVYEVSPPDWFRIGNFFASPRRKNIPNYSDVSFLVMSSLLVKADFIRRNHIRFDSYFGLTGGEDRKFMLDMINKGGRFSWIDSAVVEHHIPKERICLAFVLRREFGVGCTRSALFRVDRSDVKERIRYAFSVVWQLVWKLASLPFALVIGKISGNQYEQLRPLFDLANASGRAYGLIGRQFKMYA